MLSSILLHRLRDTNVEISEIVPRRKLAQEVGEAEWAPPAGQVLRPLRLGHAHSRLLLLLLRLAGAAWRGPSEEPRGEEDLKSKDQDSRVATIEEGRDCHVTSYLRQWTQLIRLHGRGVLKCGCTGKTIAGRVQSDQLYWRRYDLSNFPVTLYIQLITLW